MAAIIGTVKVPALMTIEAGDPKQLLVNATFELEVEVVGSPPPISAADFGGAGIRASVAKALRQAAEDIEAQQ